MDLTGKMHNDEFWAILAPTISDDPDADPEALQNAQEAALKAALAALTPDQITQFDATYRAMLDRAYSWDLWAAAYIIQGGCSDDGFDYFCDWLISRGQTVFEAALADPETLADVDDLRETDFEGFRYVAQEVYEAQTGKEMELAMSARGEPAGEPFDDDNVDDRFPRLAALELPDPMEELFSSIGARSARHKALLEHGSPLFPEENIAEFDGMIAALVGKPVIAAGAIQSSDLGGNSVVGMVFADIENIMAKSWTLEMADGQNLTVKDYIEYLSKPPATEDDPNEKEDEGPSMKEMFMALLQGEPNPDPNAYESERDSEVSDITAALFADVDQGKTILTSATRVDGNSLRLTFDNMPTCKSITLHGCDRAGTGDELGVLVTQGGETLCLSGLGVEVQLPGISWRLWEG